ncbi:MAG: trigger factor [Saccharospirillaceae bacterium]|nr:trigger factor [Pseudomonadales bacterium]NRB80286.1 trigger factor [Saccharospirillaceae bacterium]
MQVSIESVEGLQRRMTVSLSAENLNNQISLRIKDTAKRVRIDGFRPGKVPVSVVKQRYGQGIKSEVMQETIQRTLGEALAQEKVNPAGMPQIDNVKEENDMIEFTATYEIFPEIKLASFEGYEFDKQKLVISDADVDTMLESLQKQKATYTSVERESILTDQVTISFVGKVDGEAFENGSGTDSKLVLGSGQMIPGFETGIVGMKAGEEKTIDVTFPADYQSEELKGKEAKFDITVSEVAEQTLPELDKKFFKDFGAKSIKLNTFKEEVKTNMKREAAGSIKAKLKSSVIEKLVADNTILAPSALTQDEIGRLKQEAVQQFGQGTKIDPSMLPDDMFKEQAANRVKVGLLMNEIITVNKLEATEESVTAYLTDMAAVYEDPASVVDFYMNNPQQLNQVKAMLLEESAIKVVTDAAKMNNTEITYFEAIAK